jgi:hypothetical protein
MLPMRRGITTPPFDAEEEEIFRNWFYRKSWGKLGVGVLRIRDRDDFLLAKLGRWTGLCSRSSGGEGSERDLPKQAYKNVAAKVSSRRGGLLCT